VAPRTSDHNRIIGNTAKFVLGPLGLTRRGRSRVWIDDHGWWIGIVEFQPSSWSKSTGLNLSGQFLRIETDHLAFEIQMLRPPSVPPKRVSFDPEHPERFEEYVQAVAQIAAVSVVLLRSEFGEDEALLELLARQEGENTDVRYRKAIALGLMGDVSSAADVLDDVAADTLRDYNERSELRHLSWMKDQAIAMRVLRDACIDRSSFASEINRRVRSTRSEPRLPELPDRW